MIRTVIHGFTPPSRDPSPGATVAPDVCEIEDAGIRDVLRNYSHSIVPGGLLVTS